MSRTVTVSWVCDDCQLRVDVDKPLRWHWVRRNGRIEHRCAECEEKAPLEQRGVPLGKDSKMQR